jgi:hypothetical protein
MKRPTPPRDTESDGQRARRERRLPSREHALLVYSKLSEYLVHLPRDLDVVARHRLRLQPGGC